MLKKISSNINTEIFPFTFYSTQLPPLLSLEFSLFQHTKPLNRKKPLFKSHHLLLPLLLFSCVLSSSSVLRCGALYVTISTMGKYMKKAKPKGELALLDSTNTTTTTTTYFGVRTRAKTLALQNSNPQPDISPSSGSYLQLRSRRLHKPPISKHSSKRSKTQNPKSPIPNSIRVASQHSHQENTSNQNLDAEEASFGENVLDFEGRKRWVFLSFSF